MDFTKTSVCLEDHWDGQIFSKFPSALYLSWQQNIDASVILCGGKSWWWFTSVCVCVCVCGIWATCAPQPPAVTQPEMASGLRGEKMSRRPPFSFVSITRTLLPALCLLVIQSALLACFQGVEWMGNITLESIKMLLSTLHCRLNWLYRQ